MLEELELGDAVVSVELPVAPVEEPIEPVLLGEVEVEPWAPTPEAEPVAPPVVPIEPVELLLGLVEDEPLWLP